jgi:hypothetical protein
MNLHLNEILFKELIIATAEDRSISVAQVEKDYYVSLLLEKIARIDGLKIVFKGGTSLSKTYGIIHRFSEDIDLAVEYHENRLPIRQRKYLKEQLLEIILSLGLTLRNPNDINSGMDFNIYEILTPKSSSKQSRLLNHIIIETIVTYHPYPSHQRVVSSLIYDYLNDPQHKLQDLIIRYGLSPFSMFVQSIERTFIDKCFAICDYYLQANLNRRSRHLYDIHMIYNCGYLNLSEVRSILNDVIIDRQKEPNRNPSCKPGANPNEILKEIILKQAYKKDYQETTLFLLFEPVPYDACSATLELIYNESILPSQI